MIKSVTQGVFWLHIILRFHAHSRTLVGNLRAYGFVSAQGGVQERLVLTRANLVGGIGALRRADSSIKVIFLYKFPNKNQIFQFFSNRNPTFSARFSRPVVSVWHPFGIRRLWHSFMQVAGLLIVDFPHVGHTLSPLPAESASRFYHRK